MEGPIKRDKKTGKPLPDCEQENARNNKDTLRLKEAAFQSVRKLIEKGEVESVNKTCREWGISHSTLRRRMEKEDWATPKRILERKEALLKEALVYEKVYRPNGPTETDKEAIKILKDEGLTVPMVFEERPPELAPVSRKPIAEKPSNGFKKALSFKGLKGDNSDAGVIENSGAKALPSECSANKDRANLQTNQKGQVKGPENGVYELSTACQATHDADIASIVRKSIEVVKKLGKLPILKVGDLVALDKLYRTATGQTNGSNGGSNRPLVNINMLGRIGGGSRPSRQKDIIEDTSDISITVDAPVIEAKSSKG